MHAYGDHITVAIEYAIVCLTPSSPTDREFIMASGCHWLYGIHGKE